MMGYKGQFVIVVVLRRLRSATKYRKSMICFRFFDFKLTVGYFGFAESTTDQQKQ